jgi:hypothetical protein
MMDRLDGLDEHSETDEKLQKTFWRLFEQGASRESWGRGSLVGKQFLRDHANLLGIEILE